ncbi:MAG: lactonase family protein [Planctomycetes bacterium]|nr:lactonase family protein [Planctomycetota bacterium]
MRLLLATMLLSATLPAAERMLLVGGYDPDVRSFALDDSGLRPLASSRIGGNPSWIAIAPDGRMAYVCDESWPGRIVACRIDRTTGTLTPVSTASSGGKGPCHAALHPDGRWLLVANYGDGAVACLPIDADGGIAEPVSILAAGAKAHMVLPIGGGRVLVPCLGTDRVVTLACDPRTGALAEQSATAVPAGSGPRHICLAADGRQAWITAELASGVIPAVLGCDGSLAIAATVSCLPPAWQGRNSVSGLVLADAGRTLLVGNRGHDSLARFSIGADGIPVANGQVQVGATPRHLAISPDGSWIAVACQGAGRVEILRFEAGGMRHFAAFAAPKPAFAGFVP